jgi:hypothetical protein
VPTLRFETTAAEPCPYAFTGDTSDLVYFLSFAFSGRYLPVRQAGGSTQGCRLWAFKVPRTVLL